MDVDFQGLPDCLSLSQISAELVLGLCSDFQNIRRFCMESLGPAFHRVRKTQGLHMMACWVQEGNDVSLRNFSTSFQISELLATRYVILNGKAFETNYLIDFDSNFSWAWPFIEIQ